MSPPQAAEEGAAVPSVPFCSLRPPPHAFCLPFPPGLCIPLQPQYLGEVSPKKLRGSANSTMSLFWSLGKALGQVMGQR